MTMLERFLKYVKIHTTSDENSSTCPSTKIQLELAKELVIELEELGLDNVRQDKNGYVYARLKGNVENAKKIGFIAHMDTAPDLTGKDVKPRVIENYDGKDIKLNEEFTTKVEDFPFLEELKGQTIITTDGTTLLGADDKAGIAIIMEAVKRISEDKNMKHGDVVVGFTPDEEIGRGADKFDVKGFGADFAYTVDGGGIAGFEYENFNAASCKVKIQGKNVHPGSAKDTMINSVLIAMELNSMLPVNQRPEYTENYEGFFHLISIDGSVEETSMSYIIRDHSREIFEEKKKLFKEIVSFLNKKYGKIVECDIEDTYYNMKEKILEHPEIIELAKKSIEDASLVPDISPIRGGSDGSKLSFMGLLTPNFFTGGYNFHGRYELVSLDYMEKAVEVLVNVIKNNVEMN